MTGGGLQFGKEGREGWGVFCGYGGGWWGF